MRHQFAHGRLIVVVADHAAGDAGGTRRDRRLVDNEYVLARALAGFLELEGQMVGGGEAVNAGPDYGVFDSGRNSHGIIRSLNRLSPIKPLQ
jgi:hypothetical protein